VNAAGAEERITPAVLYRAVLLVFALVVVVLVFPQVVGLLLLVLLVVIIAVPLSGATTRLERVGVPRAVGAPITLLLALGVVGGIIALLTPTFVHEGRQLVDSLPDTVDQLRRKLHDGHTTSTGASIQKYVNSYANHPEKFLGPATTIGVGVAGFITRLVVVLLTALFIAIRPQPLINGAVRLVAPARRDHTRLIFGRLAQSYVGWLRGLLVGMAVLWVITYVGLELVGLPYAVVFATLTALAMVVPYFGALFSAIPPLALALTISPGKALLVLAVYVISHQVEGNLIQPIVMARAVKLHPALVAVGVLLAERLFGFLGLLVAVPILVTFKILVEELWVRPIEEAPGTRALAGDGLGAHYEADEAPKLSAR
jgi:predicted PurR-regulated permease PerM